MSPQIPGLKYLSLLILIALLVLISHNTMSRVTFLNDIPALPATELSDAE